ncbi:MAG: hypothetical protein QXQ37_06605 [Nitrososphaerota archaeon]
MSEYFHEWKAKTMVKLSNIINDVEDENLRKYIRHLIQRLAELRSRDISSWIKDVMLIADYYPHIAKQLLSLIPSEELIHFWFEKI